MPIESRPADQWKVWTKNCKTQEIQAANLSSIFKDMHLTRFQVLQQVNKWNELSAHNDECVWIYWLEE